MVNCICLKDLKVLQYSLTFQKRITFPEAVSRGYHSCIVFLKTLFICVFNSLTLAVIKMPTSYIPRAWISGQASLKDFSFLHRTKGRHEHISLPALLQHLFNVNHLNVSIFLLPKVEKNEYTGWIITAVSSYAYFCFIISSAAFCSIRDDWLLVLVSYQATMLDFFAREEKRALQSSQRIIMAQRPHMLYH